MHGHSTAFVKYFSVIAIPLPPPTADLCGLPAVKTCFQGASSGVQVKFSEKVGALLVRDSMLCSSRFGDSSIYNCWKDTSMSGTCIDITCVDHLILGLSSFFGTALIVWRLLRCVALDTTYTD